MIIWFVLGGISNVVAKPLEPQEVPTPPTIEEVVSSPESFGSSESRLYRQEELQRVIASLKANSSILITGEEGSGKSILKEAVVRHLTDEGYTVGIIQLSSTKQMLLDLCEQLGVDTYNLEGKSLKTDGLKVAIASFFQRETAFLVVDDAHVLPSQFRDWLKSLKRQGIPMLLLATRPPRSDVFLNLPRIELRPLPEYAIRELMEEMALEKGISLKRHELARLQERTGGNPMLAKRAIEEEYLGLDVETGDHGRYFDLTPLILIVGTVFMVTRFLALGTNNTALYVLAGSGGALFMGMSYALRSLPKEDRKL